MCNNYKPSEIDLIHSLYRVDTAGLEEYPRETWPNYHAPIVHLNEHGDRQCLIARFGFLSNRGPDKKPVYVTNARAETVGTKPTFRSDWLAGRMCLVPASSIYEPNYEANPDKSVRYRIWVKDQADFAIAGLWQMHQHEGEPPRYRFTMLTVNADEHPLMRRMHAPKKEKRSVVIVPHGHWEDWLACRDPELARTFLTLYPAELMDAAPAPSAPPTEKRAPKETASGELF